MTIENGVVGTIKPLSLNGGVFLFKFNFTRRSKYLKHLP